MIGEPVGAGCHSTPSNRSFSLPVLAKRQHRSAWARLSTLTQKLPLGAIAVHVSLVVIGRKPTIGGSSETDVNDPIVNPPGRPSAMPVTIVTPVGKWPSTDRNCLASNERFASGAVTVTTVRCGSVPLPIDDKRALRSKMRTMRRALRTSPAARSASGRRSRDSTPWPAPAP